MNNCAQTIKNNLEITIDELQKSFRFFLENPDKDFTRNRKFQFKDVCKFLFSTGAKSLNNELLDYFSFDSGLPTTLAFVQQRSKISPKAFQYIFDNFTKKNITSNKYKGYQLLAIDGSEVNIPHNLNNKKTYFSNKRGRGFNSLHLNAAYDRRNKLYTDAYIQNGMEANERQALIEIVKKSSFDSKTIVIVERGYEAYNVIEHIKQNEFNFLIRAKDRTSNGIASGLNLPNKEIFDEDINFLLTRRQTSQVKKNLEKYKFMPQNSNFDFLLPKSKDTYPMSFRIVRFLIGENSYEILITNLSKDEFSIETLKEMYHMRWGIETAFRDLKYTIGLMSFHSKKVKYIQQEIFAKLTMYNFCELITSNVVLQKKARKHGHQVNFTTSVSICLQHFKSRFDIPQINVEVLIRRYIYQYEKGEKTLAKSNPNRP